jgi:hypothetical protein
MAVAKSLLKMFLGALAGSLAIALMAVAYIFLANCIKCNAPEAHFVAIRLLVLIPVLTLTALDLRQGDIQLQGDFLTEIGRWFQSRSFWIGFGFAAFEKVSLIIPYLIASLGLIR